MQLHEEYRPTSFDQVLGQDKIINRIKIIEKRGLGGRAYIVNEAHGLRQALLRGEGLKDES